MDKYTYFYDVSAKKVIRDCTLTPTSVSKNDHPWLYAENNKYNREELDKDKIGKWMVFVSTKFVNTVWEKVKQSVNESHVFSAKVSTYEASDKSHAIMIYTKDYTDLEDVIRVLDYLEKAKIKLPHLNIRYKTDQQTRAGIYSGGTQKPWIYESSTIRDVKKD